MRRTMFMLVIASVLVGCGATDVAPEETTSNGAAPAADSPAPPAATSTPAATTTPVATATPNAGTTRRDPFGIEQVWVPAGSFMMGSTGTPAEELPRWAMLDNEQPAHPVTITHGFWLDRYEVTAEAFNAFVADGGYTRRELWSADGLKWLDRRKIDRLPVQCIKLEPDFPQACMTWYEDEAYAHWRGGRLPTEAEWEYAARGPENRVFPWGDTFDPANANLVDSIGLVAVGSYPAGQSWVGAFDMTGSVMEWVQDWYAKDYYQGGAMTDPQGPDMGTIKVKKGGWWGAPAFTGRAAFRHEEDPPTYSDHHIGMRIVSP